MFDVIVCTHARLEAALLREWVLWNHAAGVQHFVIFDNNDVSPGGMRDAFDEAVAPFPTSLVTTHRFPRDVMNDPSLAEMYGLERAVFDSLDVSQENPLKQRCYDMYRHRARWIAFIDMDEVFVALQNITLPEFLAQPQIADDASIGGVGVFWRVSHYSGHFLRPANGALTNYDLCEAHPSNKHIKTIVRGGLGEPAMRIHNAHYMTYAAGRRCITEPLLSPDGCGMYEHLFNESWSRPSSVHFQLNHYYARSIEDFVTKVLRGSYFGNALNSQYHQRHIGNGAYMSNCFRAKDEPTLRAAAKAAALRASLGIPWGPAHLTVPPMDSGTRAWSPALGVFYDAIVSQKTWDEDFYLRANAGRADCLPNPPLDGFGRFWLADTAEGACEYRFT